MAEYVRCVVTYLDIMGFKALFASKTAGEIATDLTRFRKFAEGDEPGKPRNMTDFILQSRVHAEIVSDAVVRVRTTNTEYRDGPFVWELLDLLHIQIECINAGIILRGATKIGDMHIGTKFGGPIFGQALTDAYLMEDKQVVYPMIAVDEETIRQHLSDPSLWQEDNSQADEIGFLEGFLTQDARDMWFIDYLRASLTELDDGVAGWIAFMRKHRDLISRQLQAGHCDRVRAKYEWLRNYHNRIVGIAPAGFYGEADEDFDWSWLDDVRTELLVP